MPDPSVDDLLADAHRERRAGLDDGSCIECRADWPCLAVRLAAALRAQTAENEQLRDRIVVEQGAVQDAYEYGYKRIAEVTRQRDAANARLTSAGHARFLAELAEARAATPVMDGNHISTTAGSPEALRAELAAMTAAACRLLYGWRPRRNNNGTHGWRRHMIPEPMTDAERQALDALEADDA